MLQEFDCSLPHSAAEACGVLRGLLGQEFSIVESFSGCSNLVYKLEAADKRYYVLRVHAATSFKSFELEKMILALCQGTDVTSPDVYIFANGTLSSFVSGDSLPSDIDLMVSSTLPLIAEKMHTLHMLPSSSAGFDLSQPMRRYIDVMCASSFLASTECAYISDLVNDRLIALLRGEQMRKLCWPCVCHNDLNCGNVILNPETKTVGFIDWEYSGVSYNLFDIACFFLEATGLEVNYQNFPQRAVRHTFFRSYFVAELAAGTLSSEDIILADKLTLSFIPVACAYWACWAADKQSLNEYAVRRRAVVTAFFRAYALHQPNAAEKNEIIEAINPTGVVPFTV